MKSQNQTILNFVTKVIIQNGIKNNLSEDRIKANIADYKKYLEENGFVDSYILKTISVIEQKSSEFVELAKAFKEAGLPMPAIQLEEEKSKIDMSRVEKAPVINQKSEEPKVVREVVREVVVHQDSCSGSRPGRGC